MRTIVVYGTKQRQIRTVCHNRDLVTTSTWRDPESAENYIDLRWHLWLGDCRWSTGRNQVRPRISAFNLEDWDFCSQTWTRLLDAVRRCILRATDFVTFDKDLKVQNPFRPRWLWSRHSNKFFRVSHTRTPKTLHVTPPTNTLSNGSSNWFPGSLISIRFYYRTMTTYILHKYKKVRLRLHAHGPLYSCSWIQLSDTLAVLTVIFWSFLLWGVGEQHCINLHSGRVPFTPRRVSRRTLFKSAAVSWLGSPQDTTGQDQRQLQLRLSTKTRSDLGLLCTENRNNVTTLGKEKFSLKFLKKSW